jgi:4-amino-4-deoxy-L-arabinose transferase-like glycosyltransferase
MSTSQSAYDYSTKGMLSSGVTGFAAIMLMAVGCFQILQGIAALANDEFFVTGSDYVFSFDVTAWGWFHVALGLLGVGIGIAILTRTTVGLLAGIALAFVNLVAEFAFLPHYPFWAALLIGFNVLVIWALCSQIAHQDGR